MKNAFQPLLGPGTRKNRPGESIIHNAEGVHTPIGAGLIKYLPAYQRAAAGAAAFNIKPLCAHLFSLALSLTPRSRADGLHYLLMDYDEMALCWKMQYLSSARPQTHANAEGLNSQSKQYNQPKQSAVFHLAQLCTG